MARVLIAGLGSIGRRHLRNLRQLGVADILLYRTRPEPLEEAPELPVFTDLDRALAAGPELVIVSNPNANHLQVALPAAEAGCDLFIEKPLSHSREGVEQLLAVVRRRQLVTLVGFDLRFEPGLRKVRALLAEGAIGRVVAIQAQVGQYLPDWHPWEDYRKSGSARKESGGGVILDLIHELDYLTWLNGDVSEVACMADTVSSLEIETEDVAGMLLRFANGAIGTLHLDYVQRAPSRTCRVIGEEGTICWDYFTREVRWYTARTGEWEAFQYADHERNDRFLEEMRHLLACHGRSEQPVVDVVEGSKVLRLALAAKEAALSRKGWTEIS
jgi:predicted dehydrogenase